MIAQASALATTSAVPLPRGGPGAWRDHHAGQRAARRGRAVRTSSGTNPHAGCWCPRANAGAWPTVSLRWPAGWFSTPALRGVLSDEDAAIGALVALLHPLSGMLRSRVRAVVTVARLAGECAKPQSWATENFAGGPCRCSGDVRCTMMHPPWQFAALSPRGSSRPTGNRGGRCASWGRPGLFVGRETWAVCDRRRGR